MPPYYQWGSQQPRPPLPAAPPAPSLQNPQWPPPGLQNFLASPQNFPQNALARLAMMSRGGGFQPWR
jgi:hypothetical protein